METAPCTPVLQPVDEDMGDDTLASKLQQTVVDQAAGGSVCSSFGSLCRSPAAFGILSCHS
eukprot:12083503-Prorocentrum_lima.AAC.1